MSRSRFVGRGLRGREMIGLGWLVVKVVYSSLVAVAVAVVVAVWYFPHLLARRSWRISTGTVLGSVTHLWNEVSELTAFRDR